MRMTKGFTLIELMVAVAVVGILATIAVSSYRSYSIKGNRTEAMTTLLSIQLAEEDYRTRNSTYGTIAQVWNNIQTTTSGKYNLAITVNTATAYTITATAQGSQTSDAENGTSCTTLTLAVSNGTVTKTPTACWLSN